jgi:hypothetical protein
MLLTAQKAGAHMRDEDVKSLQLILSREPFPDDVLGIVGIDGIEASEYEEQKRLRGNHKQNTYLQLLYQYVNIIVARVYRSMIEWAMLGNEIPGGDLYRLPSSHDNSEVCDSLNYTQKLTTLYDLFYSVRDSHIYTVQLTNDKMQQLDISGVSRKLWWEMILNAVDVYIDGVLITDEKIFKERASDYKFIDFEVKEQTNRLGYCSEHFACFLFDFFFSAMKHAVNLDDRNSLHYDEDGYADDPLYKYTFYNKYGKCKINIRRESLPEYCSDMGKYDCMVLETNVPERESMTDGMSVPAMKWYINGLWKVVYSSKESRNEPPRADTPMSLQCGKYIIKLPILKHLLGRE